MAPAWMGHDPFRLGGLCLTWSDQNQLKALPVFMLDDVEELESWSRIQSGC
jgi:hypothetical protein